MQIAEVARQTGFSRDTIRWYEKIGLITLERAERDTNNYRNYSKSTLERLLLIKGVKTFGFTLKEVKALLSLEDENQLHCNSVSEMVNLKLEALDQQIENLLSIRSKLSQGRDNCTGQCKEMFV